MKTIDRIRDFIDFSSLSLNGFDEKIGVGNGYIGKQLKRRASVGSDILEKIVCAFPEISPLWLLTGKGPMILTDTPAPETENVAGEEASLQTSLPAQKQNVRPTVRPTVRPAQNRSGNYEGQDVGATHKSLDFIPRVVVVDPDGEENILYVPLRAQAGYLSGYGDPEWVEQLPSFKLPGLRGKTYRMFDVAGVSMVPTLKENDRVICEYVPSFSDIRDGRVYVVVTKHRGIVVKRLLNRLSDRGKIVLKSDTIAHRQEFPTFELDPEEIIEMWYGRILLSADFSDPSDLYHKIADLETDMMDLRAEFAQMKQFNGTS